MGRRREAQPLIGRPASGAIQLSERRSARASPSGFPGRHLALPHPYLRGQFFLGEVERLAHGADGICHAREYTELE
jgi:hypothetical protein